MEEERSYESRKAFVSGLTNAASSLWSAVVSDEEDLAGTTPDTAPRSTSVPTWKHHSGNTPGNQPIIASSSVADSDSNPQKDQTALNTSTMTTNQEHEHSMDFSPARSEKVEELLRTYRENSPQKVRSQPGSRRNSLSGAAPGQRSTASTPPIKGMAMEEANMMPLFGARSAAAPEGVVDVINHQGHRNQQVSSQFEARRSSVSGEERLNTTQALEETHLKERVFRLSRRVQQMEESYDQLQKEHRESLSRERQMQQALQARDEKMRELLDRTEEQAISTHHNQQWESQRAKLLTQLRESESAKQELENQLAQVKQERYKIEAANQSNSGNAAAYEKELQQLRKKVQTLEEEKTATEAKLRVTESKNTVLERDIRKAESANANLQKVLEDQVNSAENEEQLRQLQEKCSSLEKRLRTVEDEREGYRQRAADLEHRLRTSESELNDLKSSQSQESARQSESMYQKLSQERALKIARLQDQVRSLEQELERCKRAQAFLDDDSVNKRVVAQLIVGYFNGVADSKQTLQALASMLDMTQEDKQAIGLLPPELPKFWDEDDENSKPTSERSATNASRSQPASSGSATENETLDSGNKHGGFVDAFIHYLMRESNDMADEAGARSTGADQQEGRRSSVSASSVSASFVRGPVSDTSSDGTSSGSTSTTATTVVYSTSVNSSQTSQVDSQPARD
eukprot:gb/GECG01003259.1/.p1 GENE.gb/GECG01003259.1/~~gb/GECG01003259.1/.p1  ORF type:complete len:688 (+),score=147.03 gb/GECG01003259.1/:1-2064(+)